MFRDPRGPIVRFTWGTFQVRNPEARLTQPASELGKDIQAVAKLIGVDEVKYNLLDRGIEVLVIGTGVYGSLRCSEAVRASVADRGIDGVVIQRTPRACRTFNTLYHQGRRVALLAHGAC